MVVQLKRFTWTSEAQKLENHVAFNEQLSLVPYLTEDSLERKMMAEARQAVLAAADDVSSAGVLEAARSAEDVVGPVYDLSGVLVHQGSTPQEGHYWTYIRDRQGPSCMSSRSSISWDLRGCLRPAGIWVPVRVWAIALCLM